MPTATPTRFHALAVSRILASDSRSANAKAGPSFSTAVLMEELVAPLDASKVGAAVTNACGLATASLGDAAASAPAVRKSASGWAASGETQHRATKCAHGFGAVAPVKHTMQGRVLQK